MDTYAVVVSGRVPELGLREVESILGCRLEKLCRRIGLIRCERELMRCMEILPLLYECSLLQEVLLAKAWASTSKSKDPLRQAEELARSAEWREIVGKAFAVRVRKLGGYPQEPPSDMLAARVGSAIYEECGEECRVDLENPDVVVRLVTSDEVMLLGILLMRPRGDRFEIRASRARPYSHPAALTPNDARLLVNLASPRERLLDPFCGTGSVLIEACMRGVYAVGVDVEDRMVRGARRNLRALTCDALADVVLSDVRTLPFRAKAFDSIATDPPYGHLAPLRGPSMESLYNALLQGGEEVVKDDGRVVFIRPEGRISSDFVRSMLEESSKSFEEYRIFVHGDLTRVICLVEV